MSRSILLLVALALMIPTGGLLDAGLGAAHAVAPTTPPTPFPASPKSTLVSGWTELLASAGPSPRSYAAADFDSSVGAVVLFGGWNGSYLSDTWYYHNGSWTPAPAGPHPSGRRGAALVYDPVLGASILFGGSNGTPLSDT